MENLNTVKFWKDNLEWHLKQHESMKYFVQSNILSYKRNKVSVMHARLRLWYYSNPNSNVVIFHKQDEILNKIWDNLTEQLETLVYPE